MLSNLSGDGEEQQESFDLYNRVVLPYREEEHEAFARQLYISVSPDEKRDEVEREIKNWIKEENRILHDSDRPRFSGLMITKGPVVLHFLECDTRELTRFVQYLHAEFTSGAGKYTQINILAFNEENSYRVFEFWGSEKVFATGPIYLEVDKQPEQVMEKAWEVYKSFQTVGDAIRSKQKAEYEWTNATLRQASEELPISPENIFMLMNKMFTSIEEYYEIYFQDEEIVLDDEISFPLPCYFSQYLEYSEQPFDNYNGFKS